MSAYGYEDDRDAPYLELQCLDCGEPYPADQGDCPRCGSANCSYDAGDAKRYADDWADREARR